MSGSGKSGLSQNNFTRFFVPINLLFSNCQVASKNQMFKFLLTI